MRPQQRTVGPRIYPKFVDVLVAVRLKPIVTYICWCRYTIVTTIKGRDLLEECRGEERRLESLPCQFWWDQEMTLEEDNQADGGGEGIYPHRFYDKAGRETGVGVLDPRGRHMDHPDAASDNFTRAHDLDG